MVTQHCIQANTAALSEEEKQNLQPGTDQAKAGESSGAFSFWGVANALADSVKKTTADLSARYSPHLLSLTDYCSSRVLPGL